MPFYGDKLCYFHLQKTGGTWVRQCLKRLGITMMSDGDSGHSPIDLVHDMVYRRRFAISSIRDPYTWLRSRWCSGEKEGWPPWTGPGERFGLCRGDTFEAFLRNYLRMSKQDNKEEGPVGRMMGMYVRRGEYEVDRVMRLEDQPEALVGALEAGDIVRDSDDLQLVRDMPVHNPAIRSIIDRATASDDLIEQVYDVEKVYCEKYDYCWRGGVSIAGPSPLLASSVDAGDATLSVAATHDGVGTAA